MSSGFLDGHVIAESQPTVLDLYTQAARSEITDDLFKDVDLAEFDFDAAFAHARTSLIMVANMLASLDAEVSRRGGKRAWVQEIRALVWLAAMLAYDNDAAAVLVEDDA